MIEIVDDDGILKEWVGYAFSLVVVLIMCFAVIGLVFGFGVLLAAVL